MHYQRLSFRYATPKSRAKPPGAVADFAIFATQFRPRLWYSHSTYSVVAPVSGSRARVKVPRLPPRANEEVAVEMVLTPELAAVRRTPNHPFVSAFRKSPEYLPWR